MIRTALLIALRSFRRRPGFTAINVVGLGVGIACCAAISLYVHGERSYDRFHADAERVYRVESTFGDVISLASVNHPFVEVLRAEHPDYSIATFWRSQGNGAVRRGESVYREEGVLYANSAVFDVFSFRLERGNEVTALAEPYTVVLSREVARRLFGDEDPVGQELRFFGSQDFTVTGVLAPPPGPTHLPLRVLLSWPTLEAVGWQQATAWSSNNTFTYVRVPSAEAARALEASFPDLIERHAGENWPGSTLSLRPLTDIHLHSNHTGELSPGGNPAYVTLFSIVALFILLLAGVNFVNLSTARSLERAREVGVRKSLGAHEGQLARQFLTEAVLLALAGLGVAAGLLALAGPWLSDLIGHPLLPDGRTLGVVALVAASGALLVGVGGGLYPALALARFRPVEVLRGRFAAGHRGVRLRQGLVVFQFAVAVVLLVGTFVVYGQLEHLRSADLGFDEAQVLAVRGPGAPRAERLAFFEALEAEAAVERGAAVGEAMPAELRGGGGLVAPGFEPQEGEDAPAFARSVAVSAGFFETLGVGILAGRPFHAGSPVDSAGVVLNEAATRQLMAQVPGRYASPADLIGETVEFWGEREVVGVVEDFHMASLHTPVVPMAFLFSHVGMTYLVRIAPGGAEPALAAVRQRWAELFPEAPLDYYFVDESFGAAYAAEERLGRLALVFAGLAILVACLGLFGLAAYAAEQRRKEIGVRRVLGATAVGLVALLSGDFLRLVAVAVVVGVPVAYLGVGRWLEGFPSRIELGPGPFLAAGALALLIALATVAGQALRAATADPVRALRSE